MQLRVARLCLDCENLHVEDRCPACGSEQYVFLSTWLPSEERRRWRRPAAAGAPVESPARRWIQRITRWIGFKAEAPHTYAGPRTRASDHVPDLNFDRRPPAPESQPEPAKDPLLQSHDR